MRMTALVVRDSLRDSINKKTGEPVQYRSLAVVDQDPEGATLMAMVEIGIPTENKGVPSNLSGHLVRLALDDIGENFRGASGRATVEKVLGIQRIEEVGGKKSA